MDINNIVELLNKNNIPNNPAINRYGGLDVVCTHNCKTYIITLDNDNLKLLEFNTVRNPKRKNRYHLVEKFNDVGLLINFIRTRKTFFRVGA